MTTNLRIKPKLYRNTGTYVSPTWAEMWHVNGLMLNLGASEADDTDLAEDCRTTIATLKVGSIEFDMDLDTADVMFGAVRDSLTAIEYSFFNRAPIEFAALYGNAATAGSQVLRATTIITNLMAKQNEYVFALKNSLAEHYMRKVQPYTVSVTARTI